MKIKKIAFSNDKKTNNLRNRNNKKYRFTDLLFGLSFPKISGVIATFMVAYVIGSYAPIAMSFKDHLRGL